MEKRYGGESVRMEKRIVLSSKEILEQLMMENVRISVLKTVE